MGVPTPSKKGGEKTLGSDTYLKGWKLGDYYSTQVSEERPNSQHKDKAYL